MQLIFKMNSNSQAVTLEEFNTFETTVGFTFPSDYRQHMLNYNGGIIEPYNLDHVNYKDSDQGISKFYPIKYGSTTMEKAYNYLKNLIPTGYLSIGKTRGQGEIIISLNPDVTYGNIKEWYPDGEINELSFSFTQLLNDMVESNE